MSQPPGSQSSSPCFHGGAFFEAVGPRFDDLSRSERTVNADVLDAWFPPAPKALQALRDHLPWLIRTSPPTDCGGFLEVVAETRGVPVECLLPGGGSSDLMFLALPTWLDQSSRVTLLDPTYGEYRHILDHVVGCEVDALPLRRDDGYAVDLEALERCAAESDLLILVNPNSPTGRHVARSELVQLLDAVPATTRVWIDETYVEYVGDEQSLEQDVVRRPNAVVCKSMSKVYALSGVRAAYLCGSAALLAPLRRFV
ncbi:MAG: aminotransferase class I/II-fold pyridoxal phosphate-dependent enzyme, partial [Planctomycetota bacterium]